MKSPSSKLALVWGNLAVFKTRVKEGCRSEQVEQV